MAETLIAQLNKDSEFLLKGVADERLPSVLDGLIAHYPFDGTMCTNLIDYDEGTYDHLQLTNKLYTIDQTVYEGEVYNIAGFFSRNVVHAGQCYIQIRLESADGTLIDGTMGLVDGWTSIASEPLYYYFHTDIQNSVGIYSYFERDFKIPMEAHGGKIVWVKIVFLDDAISDTTSYKNISFGKKYHRNFHPVIQDNIAFDRYGLQCHEATTNLIPNGDFTVGLQEGDFQKTVASYIGTTESRWKYTAYPNTDVNTDTGAFYDTNDGYFKNGCIRLEQRPGGNSETQIYTDEAIILDPLKLYTISVYCKCKVANVARINFKVTYSDDSTQWISGNFHSGSGKWERLTVNLPADVKQIAAIRCQTSGTTKVSTSFWSGYMLEESGFASAFTTSSRSRNRVRLDGALVDLNEGSFVFKCKLNSNTTDGLYSAILTADWWTSDKSKDWIGIYRGNGWNGCDTITLNIIDKSLTYAGGGTASDILSRTDHEILIGISWSASNNDFRLYAYDLTEGIVLIKQTNTGIDGFDSNFPYLDIGNLNDGDSQNCTFNFLSIYNRSLSFDEFEKFKNKKMRLDGGGNVLNAEIKEEVTKPTDVFYFPLDFDTREVSGACKARDESNLRFDDGAFVGNANINNILDDIENWVPVRPSVEYVDVPFGTGKGVRYSSGCLTSTWSGNAYCYQDYDTPETIGVEYHYGVWCYVSEDCDLDGYVQIRAEHAFSKTKNYDLTKKGTWQWLELSATSADNDYDNCRFLVYMCKLNQSTSDFKGYVLFSQPIAIQASEHIVPVDLGTNISSLNFNLHEDLGLDWSEDWSIVYFKKPIGTRINKVLTSYSIESLGCGNDSGGSGYIWWGKSASSNNIYLSTPSALDPNTYFGKYHMVSLVYNTTTNILTIKTWLPEYVCVRTYGYSTTNTNYFVNHHGFDLILGGYYYNDNDIYRCGTSFRDLIISNRQFTDSELDFINKSMMQNNSKGNLVLRKLKENIL